MNYALVSVVAIVLSLSAGMVATAQEAPATTNTYTDALRKCGAEWKASNDRKAVAKGHGMEAWQAFRAECVKRVGYTSKRRGAVGGDATATPKG